MFSVAGGRTNPEISSGVTDICREMGFEKIKIRNYDGRTDKVGVEDLERRCEVGPAEHVFLLTDSMGDPICRIRNSPMYNMLVAELDREIVGVIRGSIKVVTVHKPLKDRARVGYVLGLRVAPLHRRKGIGLHLVHQMEEWFTANQVDYAYMATEKDNEASINLFVNKLGYVKFRTPAILVHPVSSYRPFHSSASNIAIVKLKVEQAEFLYRNYMSSTEFFPHDIDEILRNRLSLGTWVAYHRGDSSGEFGPDGMVPNSWAMLSVWNSAELFKLRVGKAPLSGIICSKSSRLIDRAFPCFKVPALPDFFSGPFGFYFMYGVYREGPSSGKLVRALCKFVRNLATESKDCKAVVTEVGSYDSLKHHIPHWKLLSYPEDLWCIKALKQEDKKTVQELTKTPPTRTLFVDPREV